MRDFNLFSIYNEKESNSNAAFFIPGAIVLIAIIAPLLWYAQLKIEHSRIAKELEVNRTLLNSEDLQNRLKEYEIAQFRIENKGKYALSIEEATASINKIGTLTTEDFEIISNLLQLPVRIYNVEFNDRNLHLSLRMHDRALAAEVIKSLKTVDSVEGLMFDLVEYIEPDNSEEEKGDLFEMHLYLRLREGVIR